MVLILSNGVTASADSVNPAPNPAITVLGPEILPSASCSNALYWSNATNPIRYLVSLARLSSTPAGSEIESNVRIPAFKELPMIRVVQPAYHALPNGGHGNFPASGNLRFNCVRVFATIHFHTRQRTATFRLANQDFSSPPRRVSCTLTLSRIGNS